MKIALSLMAALIATTPLAAQTATPPTATTKPYTLDTPIETIAADPAGKALLQADFPGMLDHAEYDNFKAMSLNEVVPLAQGQITEQQIAKAKADLAKLK